MDGTALVQLIFVGAVCVALICSYIQEHQPVDEEALMAAPGQ